MSERGPALVPCDVRTYSPKTAFIHKPGTWTYSPRGFDRVYQVHDIEHRLTRSHHPWTNGQDERMNRIIKDATVGPYKRQLTS